MKRTLLSTASSVVFSAFVMVSMGSNAHAVATDAYGKTIIEITNPRDIENSDVYKSATPQVQAEMRAWALNAITDRSGATNTTTSFNGTTFSTILSNPSNPAVDLRNASVADVNAAIAKLPPFDFEAAKQQAYEDLKKQQPTPPSFPKPTPQQQAEWDQQLKLRAEVKARELQDQRQASIDSTYMAAYNRDSDARIDANNARNVAWHAAADATLEKLTQQAVAKGIDQASYDRFIEKAVAEIYGTRLALQENTGMPMPATFSTPEALKLLSHMESQKAYAAANPDSCKGNPYACGIVNKRTTIATAHPSANQTTTHAGNLPAPTVNVSLPANGEVKKLANGHTVDSNGVIKNSAGVSVGILMENGKLIGPSEEVLSAAQSAQLLSLFSTPATTTTAATTSIIGECVPKDTAKPIGNYAQKNAYVASSDTGEVYIDQRELYGVTNTEINDFIRAHLNDPAAIAAAMKKYGVDLDRIQEATGYTREEMVEYIANSGNADLKAALANWKMKTSASTGAAANAVLKDSEIDAYIRANINDPSKIAAAMTKHNVDFNRIKEATGYSYAEIENYVNKSGSPALKSAYAKWKGTNKVGIDPKPETQPGGKVGVAQTPEWLTSKTGSETFNRHMATADPVASAKETTKAIRAARDAAYNSKADKTKLAELNKQLNEARDIEEQVAKEVARQAKAKKETQQAADAALGGKGSVDWMMAQKDPVKSAENRVKSLQQLKDKNIGYDGIGAEIQEARVIADLVKKKAAGKEITSADQKRLAEATAAKDAAFNKAASTRVTSCSGDKCVKAIEKAYNADVEAWKAKAMSACGGTAVKGGSGVAAPKGMDTKRFSQCTGTYPQLRDYEKGGAKYPGGAADGVVPFVKGKVDPKIDGGKVNGKQQLIIRDVADVERLPFWSSMDAKAQTEYKTRVADMLSKGSFKSSSGEYDIIFDKSVDKGGAHTQPVERPVHY